MRKKPFKEKYAPPEEPIEAKGQRLREANEAYWRQYKARRAQEALAQKNSVGRKELAYDYVVSSNFYSGFRMFAKRHGLDQVFQWCEEIIQEKIQQGLESGEIDLFIARKKSDNLPKYLKDKRAEAEKALKKIGKRSVTRTEWKKPS